MPPYCIVCSKDLATDPHAEPPLCEFHAREKRQKLAAESQRSRELEDLTQLPKCVVRLRDLPSPSDYALQRDKYLDKTCTVVVDKLSTTHDGDIERIFAQRIQFSGKYKPDESRGPDATGSSDVHLVRAEPFLQGFLDAHQWLVNHGWRPTEAPMQRPIPEAVQKARNYDGRWYDGKMNWLSLSHFRRDEYHYSYRPDVREYDLWTLIHGQPPEVTMTSEAPPRRRFFGLF